MQQQEYDVVIVGSGIGGLCAGALLAHWGYKTMVVEKLSRIGGRCSTEEYEGFKLPTGAVAIHKGPMAEVFDEVGAPLELVTVPRLFYRLEGKDYEMPAKGALSTLLDIVNKLEVERGKLVGGLVKAVATEKVRDALGRGFRRPEKESLTFRDWLLQYTDNELALDLFDTISSLTGGHSYEHPASSVFEFFSGMGGMREVGIAAHGNVMEMEKLAKVIKSSGDVWTNCLAKRILVEGGRAKGVMVQKDGSEVEIASQVVISNAGLKGTVELAGEGNFDEGYLRLMRLKHRPGAVTLGFVASDRPLWPESGEPAILMLTGTRRITSIVPISNIVPELAPPGQHVLFAFGFPRSNLVHMDKEEEQRQVSSDLKEQLPLFEKHGRILKVEPRDIDDPFNNGTPTGFGTPIETPVKNLYNVGDGCLGYGLTGSTGAAESGKRVAETIKKTVKPGGA